MSMFFQLQPGNGYEFGAPRKPATKKATKKKTTLVKRSTQKKPSFTPFTEFKVGTLAGSYKYGGLEAIRASRAASAPTSRAASAPTRRLTFTGTADFTKSVATTEANVESKIRQDLTRNGWQISNLDVSLNGYYYGQAGINITAEVSNEFSNESHRDQLNRTLLASGLFDGIAQAMVFSNVQLNVTGAEKPSYVAPTQTTISGTPTPNPNNSGGNSSNGSGNPNGDNSGGIFGDWSLPSVLGLGAGVSATTAIVVGGVFLLVMLKK